MLKGEPFGDLRGIVSASVQMREVKLMRSMIGVKSYPVQLTEKTEVQSIQSQIVGALTNAHGDNIKYLDLQTVQPANYKFSCQIFAEFFRTLIALPKPKAISYMRVMYLDPSRLQ